MRFKLLDFFGGAVEKSCMATGQNGSGYTFARMSFEPGQVYETADPTLEKFIKGELGDVFERAVLTPELKSELEAANIPYTTSKCGSCVNAPLKAVFNPFTIVEEKEEDNEDSESEDSN